MIWFVVMRSQTVELFEPVLKMCSTRLHALSSDASQCVAAFVDSGEAESPAEYWFVR